jgi:RES domain-containing protein
VTGRKSHARWIKKPKHYETEGAAGEQVCNVAQDGGAFRFGAIIDLRRMREASSLKKFVRSHGSIGYECGICNCSDLIASAPNQHEALSSLVRALVRFHYDEWTYNPHWGGEDRPEHLLYDENPIVEHKAMPGFPRDAEGSEGFLGSLFEPPWPDANEGIAIYGGHFKEMPILLNAIRTSSAPSYKNLVNRLAAENYFEVEAEFAKLLAKLEHGINSAVPANAIFFRARIGIAKRFMRSDSGWTADTIYQPYIGAGIGAPPKARPGRLNREGVSFLYLSTDEATATAEVRPHPGHYVSIASFRCVRELRLADFGAIDIVDFSSSEEALELFHLGYTISREIGLPITPEYRQKYTATQLIADLIRRQGYDGIRFPSSVGTGENICVFQPGLFANESVSGKIVYVKGLKYETDNVASLIEPTEDDIALPD